MWTWLVKPRRLQGFQKMLMTFTSLGHAPLFCSLDPTSSVTVAEPLSSPSECEGSHHTQNFATHCPIISLTSEANDSNKDAFKVDGPYPTVQHLWLPLPEVYLQRKKFLTVSTMRIMSPQELQEMKKRFLPLIQILPSNMAQQFKRMELDIGKSELSSRMESPNSPPMSPKRKLLRRWPFLLLPVDQKKKLMDSFVDYINSWF